MSNTLLLVDAYSQIYRAFYAIRVLNGPDGAPVNAIFGFTKMLKKLLNDYAPTHVAVVYDLGLPQARLALMPTYKENRPPTPEPLDAQLDSVREVVTALGIPVLESDGEEADDIIATLALLAAQDGCRVLIATNDKDLTQIVNDQILLIRPDGKQSILVDAAKVKERYGVEPRQMCDLLSLIGDSVDDIPGVPGVGEKTAVELLTRFDSLEGILERVAEVTKPKLRQALELHIERVRKNRKMICLRTELPLPITWNELTPRAADQEKLRTLYGKFGFRTLLAELDGTPVPSGEKPSAAAALQSAPKPAPQPKEDLFA